MRCFKGYFFILFKMYLMLYFLFKGIKDERVLLFMVCKDMVNCMFKFLFVKIGILLVMLFVEMVIFLGEICMLVLKILIVLYTLFKLFKGLFIFIKIMLSVFLMGRLLFFLMSRVCWMILFVFKFFIKLFF